MATRYDVAIIGTGAGGGTLAYALAPTGKKILVLERGDYVPREKDNWDTRAVNLEGKYATKEVWRDRDGRELHPHTNYYIGGNTKFYGAALFRLRREDFGEVKHDGGVSPAWPIARAPPRRTRPTSSSSRAARSTPQRCSCARRTSGIRAGSPTAPTSSGATIWATSTRSSWPSPGAPIPRSFRRRSRSTTSTSARKSGTIRRATSPSWASSTATRPGRAPPPSRRASPSISWPGTRSTSGSPPRTCPIRTTA